MKLTHWFKKPQHEHVSVTLRGLAAALLFAVLVITVYFLIGDIAFYRAVSPLASPRQVRTMFQPSLEPTVDAVAEWMTFEYLNRVFKLAPDTLRQVLDITDPRYPRLSIRGWATAIGIDDTTALARVKQAIRAALAK